jgi:hypothetical protein
MVFSQNFHKNPQFNGPTVAQGLKVLMVRIIQLKAM